MKAMKKKLAFVCWNCRRDYRLLLELDGQPKLNVACPFCNEAGIVDLAPYLDSVTEVFRGVPPSASDITELKLPDRIPTRKPEEADHALD